MRNLVLVCAAVLVGGNPIKADTACDISAIELKIQNLRVIANSVAFDLSIDNGMDFDLGGVLIEYTVWADDRPRPLHKWYSELAYDLGGGLLAGERTEFRDFVALFQRELGLAENAENLTVEGEVLNAADADLFALTDAGDVYGMWNADSSKYLCDGGKPAN